jgi:Alpha/beta hydrolase domain
LHLPGSPVVESTIDRALAPVLVDWVAKGISPPDSRYPSLADHTLAPPTDQADVGFPNLGSAGYPYYGYLYNPIVVTDYANAVPVADLTKAYKVFISKTDSDGNEASGVRVPDVAAPLASYAGWNVRAPGHAAGDDCYYQASMLYFAATKDDRIQDHDPRLSLEERYGSKANYVAKVKEAAERLVAQRLLLPADVSVYVNAAQAQTILP